MSTKIVIIEIDSGDKMFIEKYTKTNKILVIYSKLTNGEIINRKELSKAFNVSEKTIQRD